MTILGVQVDSSASSPCAVEHRIAQAQGHFFARRSQLTCRRVPLQARLRRLYSTVGASLLWGSGGWTLTKAIVHGLETFELWLLRRTIQPSRRVDESFLAYQKRSAATARGFFHTFGIDSVAVRAIRAIHGWGGHAARLPATGTLGRILRFRDMEWWSQTQDMGYWDPHNTTKWRHSRPGRHFRWEAPLSSQFPDWVTKAQGREFWRASLPHFLRTCSGAMGVWNSERGPRMPVPADDPDPGAAADQTAGPQPPLPAPLSLHDPQASLWKLSQRLSARNFSVVCLGSDHITHMQLLGKWACADSTTRQLRDSIARTLGKVTDFLHVPWNKFLVEASGKAHAHATAFALRAIELDKSNETWTPPDRDVLQSLTTKYPEHSVYLKAAYRGQTRLDGQSRTEKGGPGSRLPCCITTLGSPCTCARCTLAAAGRPWMPRCKLAVVLSLPSSLSSPLSVPPEF